jgi:septal ring factor EnvC (AmiA/AmiB activator)
MTSALVVRRMTTIAAVAIVVGLVVGTIRVAAAWTVAAAPLTISPVSASELQAKLADERARSASLASHLSALDARSRELTAALEQAQRRLAADAATAEDLDGQLVAAKDRLAKVEAALARARQALRATTATAVIPAAARTSRGEHEDEGEEHGD